MMETLESIVRALAGDLVLADLGLQPNSVIFCFDSHQAVYAFKVDIKPPLTRSPCAFLET